MKWFSSLRKALIPQCCKRDYGKGNCKSIDFGLLGSQEMESCIQNSTSLPPPIAIKEDKLMAKESEQSSRGCAYTAALATAIAAEAAGAAIRAAAEVIRITTSMTKSSTKLTKENAAIRIQSAFRGHQARASFQASRGLDRLRRVVDGIAAKSQTTKTLYSLQTMSRVQMQLPPRYRLEEIHIPQQQKCEKENDKKKIGEGWDHGSQSKEQAEAKQLNRKEAASKRERALAYAFSHQWRSSSKSTVPAMNLNRGGKFVVQEASNPQLGWSWLARLMAGKPWEKKQNGSFKTPSCVGGARPAAIAAKHGSDSGSSSPAVPLSPPSSAASSRKDSLSSRRNSQCSPRGKVSARLRRHSVAGLPSVTDSNGLGRSLVELNKNHVASTQAAKTGSRLFPTVKEQPAPRIRRLSLNK
ncbi:protein IQ-DOMAIN 3-like [Zingiber officinale]|uniref:protein IQ-DOMAIN 3-like n=1 Tax=Zingiber officinale TaxID=94328 RepID=UPI001C4D401A|nr:protein IQ-DOMAIN 3-like [Zingiber officinale]